MQSMCALPAALRGCQNRIFGSGGPGIFSPSACENGGVHEPEGIMDDRKSFANVVTIFPPEKAPDEDVVLLKLQLKDGKILRLAFSSGVAKHLATWMLLHTGQTPNA